jgi:hypothetical protein
MNVPLSDSAEQPLSLRPPQYHSYLLRFWEERGQQPSVWRFSLEDPQTDQRYGFASLEALDVFRNKDFTGATGVGDNPPADYASRRH